MTPDGMLGRMLGGRYRVHEVLAVGGMGVVYSGAHEGTGRPVAVKVLRPELLTQHDLVRRVAAEARLAVEASHPNVVQVLDAGTDENGLPYLVLERLYGQPLEALLAEPLSLLTTAQVLVPIANAVAMLHRLGIVHRDLKPANIFLHRDSDGRVTPKLLDFGIAKALARGGITFTGAALGTPAYMAPEQALGHHFGGRAADVWSMGMVFARCLTGRLPFADARVGGSVMLRSVLRREHLPDVPDAVALLLGRALAFEPSERLADMTCFRDELLAALAAIDGQAAWPGADSVTYGPGECVLAEAIAAGPAPAPQAFPVAFARPRNVDTRTLTGAGAPVRGEHARLSRLARAPLFALAAAALALVVPWTTDHGAPSEPLGSELASRPTAPPLPPLQPEPRQEASEDISQAAAASALAVGPPPASVEPGSGGLWHRANLGTFSSGVSPRAAAVPAKRGAAAELAEPGAAQAVISPQGAREAPHRFRVGANRAPIIE